MVKTALKAEIFNTVEVNISGKCIWCGLVKKKNKAHIISKKITQDNLYNILNSSVCIGCNSKWGKVEDWLLNKSPMNLYRFLFHQDKSKGMTQNPQYFYQKEIKKWLAGYTDSLGQTLSFQQILFSNYKPNYFLLGISTDGFSDKIIKDFCNRLKRNKIIFQIKNNLPTDFCSRIIVDKKSNIIISSSIKEAQEIKKWIFEFDNSKFETNQPGYEKILGNPNEIDKKTINFFWSDEIWKLYGIKIFFEFLAFHKSSDFCSLEIFNEIRETFLKHTEVLNKEIIKLDDEEDFMESLSNKNMHIIFSKLDCTNKKFIKSKLNGDAKIIYTIESGIIWCHITIGFCPQIIIGVDLKNPNIENDMFYTNYDFKKGKFSNVRLSEKWENNKMLIYSTDIHELLKFPSRFKIHMQ